MSLAVMLCGPDRHLLARWAAPGQEGRGVRRDGPPGRPEPHSQPSSEPCSHRILEVTGRKCVLLRRKGPSFRTRGSGKRLRHEAEETGVTGEAAL